jgi:hypothetical protein
MDEIEVYAFEAADDEPTTGWTTDSFPEAQSYARENGYAIIARTYVFADSDLVEDYRPDHALDGTPLDDGLSGQDRESYTDTQDRESYVVDPTLEA